jgi:hypothetical protein
MSCTTHKCCYCGKDNFRTKRGLTQHLKTSAICGARSGQIIHNDAGYYTAQEGMAFTRVNHIGNRKRPPNEEQDIDSVPHINCKGKLNNLLIERIIAKTEQGADKTTTMSPGELTGYHTAVENNYEEIDGYNADNDNESVEGLQDSEEEEDDFEVFDLNNVTHLPQNHALKSKQMVEFREYVAKAPKMFARFTQTQEDAITCMATLRKTKASLDTYNAMYEWHLKCTKQLKKHEKLGDTKRFLSRDKVFKLLRKRYNVTPEYYGITKTLELPSSKTRIDIVCNDAGAMIRSLLTDPRVRQEEYLFHNNDPFSPPPEDLDYLGDINTGRSYLETYRRHITDRAKQILLPVLQAGPINAGGYDKMWATTESVIFALCSRKWHVK